MLEWDAGGAGLRIGALRAYAQNVTYTYDAAGRLIGVVDPTGASAVYQYDAAGNIVSIQRNAAGTVVVIGFTPSSGPAGTQVMISGAGFGTTSNTSVKFNGVAATPTSVTSTTIVAPVPSGATTGPIMVTAPGGTATSLASFTVGAAPAAPTISGFTPQTAVPGTAVTISGTNFDTTATNDKVLFNTLLATVTAATSTSLTATVPAAGSGHITVETSAGHAVTTSDFIIPPAPHATTDVLSSARMTIGQSATVTVGTAGKIALMLFDGTAGQRVSLLVTSSTIADGSLIIYGPDGNNLGLSANLTNNSFLDAQLLPKTGTYTILVAPSGTNTGSVTFTLYNAADFTGTITANGSAVNIPITTPGQNGYLTFTGNTGDRVSLLVSPVVNPGGCATVSVLSPDGALYLVYAGICGSYFSDLLVLPQTGTYSLKFDPTGSGTGTSTATLYTVPPDFTGTITANGSPVNIPITTPAQNGFLTFTGNTGDRVSLQVNPVVNPGGCATISVLNPDNTTFLVAPTGICGSYFSDLLILPQTGTYTLKFDPSGSGTGTSTATLWSVPPDFTGTISANGSPVNIPITTPAQNGFLTFTGNTGDRVSLQVNPVVNPGGCATISVLNPDNATYLIAPRGICGSYFSGALSLAQTGNYTLKFDPSGSGTGTSTATLWSVPPDVTGTLTINGPAVPVTITTPGQQAQLTFQGTASQQLTVQVTNDTISCVTVALLSGTTTLTSKFSCGGNFNLASQTLPSTSTYTVSVAPAGTATGSLNVAVTSP